MSYTEQYLQSEGAQQQLEIPVLVNCMVQDAIHLAASDLHIEPWEKSIAVRARVNGVLTEVAHLPLELLEYDVDVETAGGHTKAARLTLDRLAIGKLVERSVPALVVPRGQMKTNLLGMSYLDRLESWEVHADRLMLHGYP